MVILCQTIIAEITWLSIRLKYEPMLMSFSLYPSVPSSARFMLAVTVFLYQSPIHFSFQNKKEGTLPTPFADRSISSFSFSLRTFHKPVLDLPNEPVEEGIL